MSTPCPTKRKTVRRNNLYSKRMTKLQLIVIGAAVVLFLVLYFGFDTTPRDIQALEKTRALSAEQTNLEVLLQEAKATLPAGQLNPVLALEQQLEEAPDDSTRAPLLKDLSSRWFSLGYPAIAGGYAEQVAFLENTESSWAIAGTTFTICVQRSQEEKIRNYCTDKAVESFENAISIDPTDIAHRVNLALLYTENPPLENPMKGITMLLDLNRANPESVLVLNALGRLAIRTGQYDRALERLEKAQSLEPNNANTTCLLAQVYEGLGDNELAQQYSEQCRQLSEKAGEAE
jgi:tetratricopeptide (TPR) repeat protein